MNIFRGVDGGGTKTDFLLIDSSGSVLARRRDGSGYYLEIGIENLQNMLIEDIRAVLSMVSLAPADITYAFLGLPAYGESTSLLPRLDSLVEGVLPRQRYQCANDVVCAWAGALGGGHGITVVAGTGSIAYGEYASHSARAGGWGELFSDEGSAFWVAREALNLFSRMSDGRTVKSLHALTAPRLSPSAGAALYAATLAGSPLGADATNHLSRTHADREHNCPPQL